MPFLLRELALHAFDEPVHAKYFMVCQRGVRGCRGVAFVVLYSILVSVLLNVIP
jgi:hypothetical protein